MSEFVAEGLLTLLSVIVSMILLGFALSAITMITGEGSNPGLVDTFMKGLASLFVQLG